MIRKAIILCFLVVPFMLASQDYTGSAGFRGGYSSGIGFKGFMDEEKALEALVGWRDGGMQFTMLLETYRPVFLGYSEHVFLYLGYGAHVGFTRWYERYQGDVYINGHPTYHYSRHSSPVIGADAIAGLEYRMYRVPLAFGLDIKPFVEFFGESFISLNPMDMGFSVRYTF